MSSPPPAPEVTEEIRETAITAVAVSINIHRVPNEQIRALYDNIAAALASFSSKAAEEARAAGRVRWSPYTESPDDAKLLWSIGDMIHVWVNEGDIISSGERIDTPAATPSTSCSR